MSVLPPRASVKSHSGGRSVPKVDGSQVNLPECRDEHRIPAKIKLPETFSERRRQTRGPPMCSPSHDGLHHDDDTISPCVTVTVEYKFRDAGFESVVWC